MKIGIIGAMEIEVDHLKAEMTTERTVDKAGMKFFEGKIGDTDVVVVQCGVGKVNAAACVQVLCDCFDVTHVINTGVAGSMDADIDIGDIVVSEDAIYHDFDVTPLGYKPGEVPGVGTVSFPADKMLHDCAVKAVQEAAPDIHVFSGRVVSGDQFIAGNDQKKSIHDLVGGMCTEMEGTAIAQVAYLNKVPFVIIRAISDKADNSGSEDYPTFEKKAARHCAAVVEYMLKNL